MNRFTVCEPVHAQLIGMAVMVLEVFHGVMQALDWFLGSRLCEPVQVWNRFRRCFELIHCFNFETVQTQWFSMALHVENRNKLFLPSSNVQSKLLALDLLGCEPQINYAYLVVVPSRSSNSKAVDHVADSIQNEAVCLVSFGWIQRAGYCYVAIAIVIKMIGF